MLRAGPSLVKIRTMRPSVGAIAGTTRPLSSLVAGTLTAAASTAGAHGLTPRSVAAGLTMAFLAAFGFAVNDIFDYQKDRTAGVRRPIAMGALSRTAGGWLAAAMLLSAGLLARVVGSGGAVAGATAALLLLYSPIARRFPLAKGAYIAILCCAPLWYGATAGSAEFPWTAYAALACFVLGREVLMDAEELPGDSRAGIRTIAAVLGAGRAAGMGQCLMLLAAGWLMAIVHGTVARSASTVTLAWLIWIFTWPGLDRGRRSSLSRLPMLLGSVALACSGV